MGTALNYLYLSPSHAGGKDQVGLNLLKGFYELGYTKELSVICFDFSKETILEIAPDIKVITVEGNARQKGELGRMATLTWLNTFVVPRLVREHGIEVLFHLSCNTGLWRFRCKSIVLPHDIKAVSHRVLANVKVPFYKYILYRCMYYLDFRNADGIVAISDTDKKEISTHYAKFSHKITRIYNPIDMQPRERNLAAVQKTIVAINLQFHHKNIITLIKAYELIRDKLPHKLVLIGNVPDRVQYLKEYVVQHNLEDCIRFTGFVSDAERDDLFQSCSLYVNPTLYEGFGMTAIEAMISQIPTLISKIPTNYEVTKKLCAYYEPPENADALAQAILLCLDNYPHNNLAEISQTIYDSYNYKKISGEYISYFSGFLS